MNSGSLVPEDRSIPIIGAANVLVSDETKHDDMLKRLQDHEKQLQTYERSLIELTVGIKTATENATDAVTEARKATAKSDKTNELVVLGFKVLLFMVGGMVIAVVAMFSAFVIYMKQSGDSDSTTKELIQAIGASKPTVQVVEPSPNTAPSTTK